MPRLLVFSAALLALACGDARPLTVRGPVELTLLHTSDTHSQLFSYRERIGFADALRGLGREGEVELIGGFARLATLAKNERRRATRALHLDSGDVFQGTLAFERWGGEPELLALGALGVDAQALGNHELDRGAALVRERYRELAPFPLLAANYVPDTGGGVAEVLAPFAVLPSAGLRVGVIGVANVASVRALRERPSELGVIARDAAGGVQGAIDTLRPLVDVIVVATHLGLAADAELVRATTGVDAVLGGHQHIVLDEPIWVADCGGGSVRDAWGRTRRCAPRRVPIVHSGAYAKYLGRLTLRLDDDPAALHAGYDALDRHEVTSADFALLPAHAGVAEDPALVELLAPYRAERFEELGVQALLGWAPALVARNGATGGDSPLGNFAAEAARHMAHAELAVLGASSLRRDMTRGAIDLDALERSFPFDDALISVRIAGRALEEAFERAAGLAGERDCRVPIQIAGALVRVACPCETPPCARAFVGETSLCCATDAECATLGGACSAGVSDAGFCFLPLERDAVYSLATTTYLADGGLFDAAATGARLRVAAGVRDAVEEALEESEPCLAATLDCESGCPAELARRVLDACHASGVACPEPDAACVRAQRVCEALPCLNESSGARRDGRIGIVAR